MRSPKDWSPAFLVSEGVVFPSTGARVPLSSAHNVRLVRALLSGPLSDAGDRVLLAYKLPGQAYEPSSRLERSWGVCAAASEVQVVRVLNVSGQLSLSVRGVRRLGLEELREVDGVLLGKTKELPEEESKTLADFAHFKEALEVFLSGPVTASPPLVELRALVSAGGEAQKAADLLAAVLQLSYSQQLQVLTESELGSRIRLLTDLLGDQKPQAPEADPLRRSRGIRGDEVARFLESFIRGSPASRGVLESGGRGLSLPEKPAKDSLEQRIRKAGMPAEAEEVALRECRRLASLSPTSQERPSLSAYVELLATLPWSTASQDRLDVEAARAQLAADHCGLEDVKKRVLEFLAVSQLKGSLKGPILCLVGPPGVGKTSVARSIAAAVGRSFQRISLGGVSDQSEIRGHRRTYLGSMPGRIIQGILDAKVNNPVLLLDEIDKMGAGLHGDPAAALLEVLDPAQNHSFTDHYLNVPFSLEKVLFIGTANDLGSIPGPLRDRMEVIHLRGYTAEEKVAIARSHLLPRQLEENGLQKDQLTLTDDALATVAKAYTREAGVRELERKLGQLCRSTALKLVEAKEPQRKLTIEAPDLEDMLGREKFGDSVSRVGWEAGVAAGLAWSEVGGRVLLVEASKVGEGSRGRVSLTGHLGHVMKESAQIAKAWMRSNGASLGLDQAKLDSWDVHVHFPAGAVAKDGPSAGVTVAVALVSLFSGRRVRSDTAMTGELSLRGLVLSVGGLKEKLLAAKEAGFARVLVPKANEGDLAELPESLRGALEILPVARAQEALELALEGGDGHKSATDVGPLIDFMSKL